MSLRFALTLIGAATVLGTSASANNSLALNGVQDSRTQVELGPVSADAPGVVEVYDLRSGAPGVLLGSEAVEAGTNADVRISLNPPPQQGAVAILRVGGAVVDTEELQFFRSGR